VKPSETVCSTASEIASPTRGEEAILNAILQNWSLEELLKRKESLSRNSGAPSPVKGSGSAPAPASSGKQGQGTH
jgi:hypothetical protein